MKQFWLKGLLGLLVLCFAIPAFAVGIDNTHHSMKDYLATGSKYTCYACHGMSVVNTPVPGLGTVGSFCYNQCHNGTGLAGGGATINPGVVGTFAYATGVVTTTAAAASGIQALQNGHGMVWASLPVKDSYTTLRTGVNWPYMTTGAMQCTTCHDVHNNTFAPFLRAPLSTAANTYETPAAGVTNTFCVTCHSGSDATGTKRYNLIASLPNGAHVIETGVDNLMTARALPRHARSIAFKGGAVFMTVTSWGTQLNGLAGTSWNLGGKLGGTNATGKQVGCYTCHQVHMNAALTGPTGETFSRLTSMAYTDNNLHTNAGGDDLCVGCHGAAGAAPANENPGTTAYYHPVNASAVSTNITDPNNAVYTVSTGAFAIAVNITGKPYGVSGRLVCTSCHAPAHSDAPVANSMVLNPVAPKCATCHNSVTFQGGTSPNSHHVYGGGTNYIAAGYTQPSYKAANDNLVDLSDGLQCNDCHVFNSTAHNWL